MMSRLSSWTLRRRRSLVLCAIASCRQAPPPRQFTLVGQVVAVAPDRNEITIKHEDIKNFMPGMTMPFKVQDPGLLKERAPGDLVTATLVVGEVEAYLSSVTKTGSAPVTDAPPAPVAEGLKPGDTVADGAFQDQDGTARRLADWRGHRVALTFVYTRCPLPEFCPLMDRHFVAVQQRDRQGARVRRRAAADHHDGPGLRHAGGDEEPCRPPEADLATWAFLTPGAEGSAAFFEQFGLIVERDGSRRRRHHAQSPHRDPRRRRPCLGHPHRQRLDARTADCRSQDDSPSPVLSRRRRRRWP